MWASSIMELSRCQCLVTTFNYVQLRARFTHFEGVCWQVLDVLEKVASVVRKRISLCSSITTVCNMYSTVHNSWDHVVNGSPSGFEHFTARRREHLGLFFRWRSNIFLRSWTGCHHRLFGYPSPLDIPTDPCAFWRCLSSLSCPPTCPQHHRVIRSQQPCTDSSHEDTAKPNNKTNGDWNTGRLSWFPLREYQKFPRWFCSREGKSGKYS